MSWYRLEVGATSAPRMRRLAQAMGCPIDQAVGRWVMLVDFVLSEAPDGATAELDPRDVAIAASWDGPPEELLRLLAEVGILDADGVLAGAERMVAGHREAERKRIEREAKKANGCGESSRTVQDSPGRTRTVLERPASRARADRPTDRPTDRPNPDSSEPVSDRSKPNALEPLTLIVTKQEQPILTYPSVGRGSKAWHLTGSLVDNLAAAFPGVDVVAEARKALAWIQANPAKRKTPAGYPRFLTNWIAQANDRGNAARPGPAPAAPVGRDFGRRPKGGLDGDAIGS